MTDRLGDQEVAWALHDAIGVTVNRDRASFGIDRDSPWWIEVAWAPSEADLMIVRKGSDDL